jgi:hypothetical protein
VLPLGASVCPSFAAKPAPSPPPPPPVRYRIQYWDYPSQAIGGWPVDMNNLGQVVGWCHLPDGTYHGYLYDPDLDPNTALDLDVVYRALDPGFDGWRIHSATGINDLGVIVGKIDDPAGTIRTFLLDPLGIVLTPGIKLLPDEFVPEGAVIEYLQINNNLDIVTLYQNPDGSHGAYFFNYDATIEDVSPGTLQYLPGPIIVLSFSNPRLNNPTAAHAAQVCGNFANGSFRWTSGPVGKLEMFSGSTARDINDAGELCGDLQKSGKRYPMRLPNSTPQVLTGAPSHYGTAINNSRDVLLDDASGNTSLFLFRDDLGYLDLDKLVTGSAEDLAIWFGGDHVLDCMNDRDPETGFCQIVGRVDLPNGPVMQYILMPEPVSAP